MASLLASLVLSTAPAQAQFEVADPFLVVDDAILAGDEAWVVAEDVLETTLYGEQDEDTDSHSGPYSCGSCTREKHCYTKRHYYAAESSYEWDDGEKKKTATKYKYYETYHCS
ncbi:MAG TPA: hypothetical protein VM681_01140 [Candidatus Thermoplasmatota archaeon]|nr:hypothetical protein [Candidatus Thermoplasmatota archaeon]